MDILTHAISGIAVASCVATYVKTSPLRKVKILTVGLLGGCWPDIDAVSMWSGFDNTFGQLFNLHVTGRIIYGSKFWYSHHAFFHSLLGSLFFGLLLISTIYFFYKLIGNHNLSPKLFLRSHIVFFITFILSYWAHILGDLPTPASVWGGVALFWPLSDYVGGLGKIWWWNNYDIFLLILFSIIINLTLPAISLHIRHRAKAFTSIVIGLVFVLIIIQINTRQYDYVYIGNTNRYAEMETKSRQEQKQILGNRVYRYMVWLDNKLPFYF